MVIYEFQHIGFYLTFTSTGKEIIVFTGPLYRWNHLKYVYYLHQYYNKLAPNLIVVFDDLLSNIISISSCVTKGKD